MTNKQILFQYLKSQRLMSLSTGSDKPWTSNVYYAINDDFNMYFISEPTSQHCQDLEKNNRIACSVADTHQLVSDKKKGVQIDGSAFQLHNEKSILKALDLWNKANTGFENIINWDNMKNKVIKGKMYMIKPRMIKFLNEELYGPEGFKTFRF